MVDIQKTQNTILTTLFQDGQVDGSISEQDMRNFVVSVYSPGRLVSVEEKADFPVAVSGVIPLAADTCYRIVNNINLGTDVLSITAGSTVLEGLSNKLTILETSSGTALITSTKHIEILNLTIKNNSGPSFSFTGTSNQTFRVKDSIITSAAEDTLNGGAAFVFIDSQFAFGSAGLTVSGVWNLGLFSTAIFRNIFGSGTCLTISPGATFRSFTFTNGQFILGSGQTGIDIAADVIPTAGGSINNSIFDTDSSGSVAIEPGKINQTSLGWNFANNAGIEDSSHVGAIEFNDNALVTTINTVNVYETINTAAWIIDPISERFILRVADSESLEHLGGKNMRTLIIYSAAVEGATPNQKYEIQLLKNGVEIDKTTWDYRSSPINVSHVKITTMDTNDYLTLKIRNITGTANVTVASAQINAVKSG